MKQCVLIFCIISLGLIVEAQNIAASPDSITNVAKHESSIDTSLTEISYNIDKIASRLNSIDENCGRYKMYQTENIYNLLKLDTATGRIEQVQWSLKEGEEMTVWINPSFLSYTGKTGTFELYPTKNMYQFILLDTTDGRTWHVQWGTESKKRWIQRIY